MRASIIVLAALALLVTTPALADDEIPPPPRVAAKEKPARHPHRLLVGGSLGGGGYGGDQGSALFGLDLSYAYRIPSGADFGVTTTLGTGQIFAGAFADIIVAPLSRTVSWRLGADAGVHRVSNHYRGVGGFLTSAERYHIVSAPYGVFLPYAGGKMSFDRTSASGSAWGFQLQVRQDVVKSREMVVVSDFWDEVHHVGGRTITFGFYLGHGF